MRRLIPNLKITSAFLSAFLVALTLFTGCGGGEEGSLTAPGITVTPTVPLVPSASPSTPTTGSPTIPVSGGVEVRLVLESASVEHRQTVKVVVEVNPRGMGISSGEINMAFNPAVMQLMGISPGNLLGPNPLLGAEKTDRDAGKAVYALARVGPTTPPTPRGTFATVEFRIVETAPSGVHAISLTRVGLANERFEEVKLGSASGAMVTVR